MEIIYLKPSEKCPDAEAGDFLFIKGTGWISKAIMLVEPFSHVVSFTEFPFVADAQAKGVIERGVDVYRYKERVLVRLDASEEDRQQMLDFLDSVLIAKWRYDFLGFFVTGLMILTGGGLTMRRHNTSYCSGLQAETMVRAGYIFDKSPHSVRPYDLAKHVGV